jgi:hypothetical protein
MRAILSLGLIAVLVAACGDGQLAKGDKGEQGPPGPPGPGGTAIEMAELECKGECSLTCGPTGKILNAYVLGTAPGRLIFEDVNRATFRRTTNTPVKLVLACIPK